MIIKLKRNIFLDDRIFGSLSVNGEKFVSGERIWQDNQKNISCIPVGTYECCRYWSRKYKHCLFVMNVPNRSNILIHTMNWPNRQSQGCIGVGMYLKDIDDDGIMELYQSRKALDKILSLIGSKEKIFLEITEDK